MTTKKVKMLVRISGSRPGKDGQQVDWPKAGETISVAASEAEDLIRQRFAVDPSAPVENALAEIGGVETAVAGTNTAEGQKSIREQIKPDDDDKKAAK